MAMNLNAKWKEKEAARKSKVVFMGKYQGFVRAFDQKGFSRLVLLSNYWNVVICLLFMSHECNWRKTMMNVMLFKMLN